MAIASLSTFPASFVAGDTIKILLSGVSYPAPDWTAEFLFAGPEKFAKAATASGTSHFLKLTPEDTETRRPGLYAWTARATLAADATERATIASGTVFLLQNSAEGTLTFAENALALIEAHITGRLPAGLASHNFNGNSIQKISIPEALKVRDQLRAEVATLRAAELGAGGLDSGAIIPVFFQP